MSEIRETGKIANDMDTIPLTASGQQHRSTEARSGTTGSRSLSYFVIKGNAPTFGMCRYCLYIYQAESSRLPPCFFMSI
ncbi:uncharacterized protein UHOD_11583 [Ustilago sp. UG-2017b]|nr:uncharacterized protein UHOD_11583 [Ustilago sp. UG-2017b]